jgi:hypothetical protein
MLGIVNINKFIIKKNKICFNINFLKKVSLQLFIILISKKMISKLRCLLKKIADYLFLFVVRKF